MKDLSFKIISVASLCLSISCFCDANDGSAVVNSSNGSDPYTYSGSHGHSGGLAVNLQPGTNTVTISDHSGCSALEMIKVQTECMMDVVTNVQSVSALGAADGSISANVSGGVEPYNYEWSTGSPSSTISGLSEGSYTLTVTDANDCTELITETIAFGSTDHWMEAECSITGNNWISNFDPDASEGIYMEISPGNNAQNVAPSSPDDHLRFEFYLSESGIYTVYIRLQANGRSSDSFWVRANGGRWIKFNRVQTGGNFLWVQVYDSDMSRSAVTFAMSSGLNVIDVAYRDDGTYIDKVYVTKDGTAPTGSSIGPEASNCTDDAVLSIGEDISFDLSAGPMGPIISYAAIAQRQVSHYRLERLNLEGNWTFINEENHKDRSQYEYQDDISIQDQSQDVFYYRLIAILDHGASLVSQVKSIFWRKDAPAYMRYDGSMDQLWYQSESELQGQISAYVYDVSGQLLRSKELVATENQIVFENLKSYPSGIYIVHLHDYRVGKSLFKKIII